MKINSAITQVGSELADILLSVDFPAEDQKRFKLQHSSVTVSYNLEVVFSVAQTFWKWGRALIVS